MISQKHRFHGQKAITRVYRQGQAVRGAQISLKYLHNNRADHFRVAVVVSRKVHKSAVVRNRIRRRIYEALRNMTTLIGQPWDLVFVVYSDEIATLDYPKLQNDLKTMLEKAAVI